PPSRSARAGRPGGDPAARDAERGEDRLDARHRFPLPAGHEARSVAGTRDPAGRTNIDEPEAAFLQPAMTADRIAPVRVAAIGDHVPRRERVGEGVEHLVDARARRNPEDDGAGWGELRLEAGDALHA